MKLKKFHFDYYKGEIEFNLKINKKKTIKHKIKKE